MRYFFVSIFSPPGIWRPQSRRVLVRLRLSRFSRSGFRRRRQNSQILGLRSGISSTTAATAAPRRRWSSAAGQRRQTVDAKTQPHAPTRWSRSRCEGKWKRGLSCLNVDFQSISLRIISPFLNSLISSPHLTYQSHLSPDQVFARKKH